MKSIIEEDIVGGQQQMVEKNHYNNNPSVKIKLIPSTKAYPFSINKVVNFVELSYTCLMDRKAGKQLLGMQVIGGYRMLRIKRQISIQNTYDKQFYKNNNQQNNDNNFIIVFILLVDDLNSKLDVQNKQQDIKSNDDKMQQKQQKITINSLKSSILYVPFSIYQQLKYLSNRNKLYDNGIITSNSNKDFANYQQQYSQQHLTVEVIRFPITYGPNLHLQSIDQSLQKVTITNLKLSSNDQQNNQIKQLITKIIVHSKFSINMKKSQSTIQEKNIYQFFLFPQSYSKKVIIDLQWIDENGFLKHLQKLSMKTKTKLIKMKKINLNSSINRQQNCYKHYLEFQIVPVIKNQQLLKNKKLYITKFIPGKTVIDFQPSSNFNPSLEPFIQTLQLSQIYYKIFIKQQFFTQLSKRILSQINVDSTRNKFICLKSDRSIGIGAILNYLTENYLIGKRFVKINCQKFATLNEFFNRLKKIPNNGNTLIFIKNLSWIENLSKNEQVVQDTMKSIIQKIYKTLQSAYQSSLCHFASILYFSHTQIPEQLPKGAKRMVNHLQKTEKLQILNEIFQYLQKNLSLNHSMKQTVTNMLINSVGWTRIYKFLLSVSKATRKEPLTDKSLAAKIQKDFSLQNVQNVTQVSWSDIGGLETAKEEIIQTVLLPTKHPQIFDEWIRPRTGLLFYGPPGTGKTLLGKCIAKECKMGFISVKGPQLLNMYVGESQKNVRQVFQRAKESKPCIVFMDQLDALVPKRGNSSDSNAVMDRIVAQLLMQIDMASQNQVFVIGATNRPDLLDPSILRAGRFDKQIYLGISKNKEDRIKILKAQTRNSKLQQKFDYELIEKNVPLNFTGADFYGLTSKSMMRAVQRSIESYQKGQVSDPQVMITTQDFLQIIPSVKPSVSEDQIRHYESLKERFSF